MKLLYEINNSPYLQWFPTHAKYCSKIDIDNTHQKFCNILEVLDVFNNLEWKFEKRFRDTEGQAEWDHIEYPGQWFIRYSTKYWLPMGEQGRRNTIAHEICHLAVEHLYGHGNKVGGKVVTSHGPHWEELMNKCGEDPRFNWQ